MSVLAQVGSLRQGHRYAQQWDEASIDKAIKDVERECERTVELLREGSRAARERQG